MVNEKWTRFSLSVLIVTLLATHTGATNNAEWDSLQTEDAFSAFILSKLYDEIAAGLPVTPANENEGYFAGVQEDVTTPVEENYYIPSNDYSSPKWVKPRQPEAEDKVVPVGFQFVSGGAGEGNQHLKPEGTITNKQEVKTDSDLPSYCSPPNPCPKGKTSADGCQENIPDTAEFNSNYVHMQMQAGYCSCDYEHMDNEACMLAERNSNAVSDGLDGRLVNRMSNSQNPFVSIGEKRKSLTAKKGGEHILHKRSYRQGQDGRVRNPFLSGPRLSVVAKKSPMI